MKMNQGVQLNGMCLEMKCCSGFGVNILLKELWPYPKENETINKSDYMVRLIVKDN